MPRVPFAVCALYEYELEQEDDLPFNVGQIITVTEIPDDQWYIGHYVKDGQRLEGMFPVEYVELSAGAVSEPQIEATEKELPPVPKPVHKEIEDDWDTEAEPLESTPAPLPKSVETVKSSELAKPEIIEAKAPVTKPLEAQTTPTKLTSVKSPEAKIPEAVVKNPQVAKSPEIVPKSVDAAPVAEKETPPKAVPEVAKSPDSDLSRNFNSRRTMFDNQPEEKQADKPVRRTNTGNRLNFSFPESPEQPKRRESEEAAPPRISIKERLALIQKQEQEMQQREEQERKRREQEDEKLRIEEELRNRELAAQESESAEELEESTETSKPAVAPVREIPKIPGAPVVGTTSAETAVTGDEEEAHMIALRERMARISGAGNVGGFSLGMMLGRNPESSGAPRKAKKKDISAMSDLERELYLASVEYEEAHGEELQEEEGPAETDRETLVGARETETETLAGEEDDEEPIAAPVASSSERSLPVPAPAPVPTPTVAPSGPAMGSTPPSLETAPTAALSGQTTDLGLATEEQSSSEDEFSDASEMIPAPVPRANPILNVRQQELHSVTSDSETAYEADEETEKRELEKPETARASGSASVPSVPTTATTAPTATRSVPPTATAPAAASVPASSARPVPPAAPAATTAPAAPARPVPPAVPAATAAPARAVPPPVPAAPVSVPTPAPVSASARAPASPTVPTTKAPPAVSTAPPVPSATTTKAPPAVSAAPPVPPATITKAPAVPPAPPATAPTGSRAPPPVPPTSAPPAHAPAPPVPHAAPQTASTTSGRAPPSAPPAAPRAAPAVPAAPTSPPIPRVQSPPIPTRAPTFPPSVPPAVPPAVPKAAPQAVPHAAPKVAQSPPAVPHSPTANPRSPPKRGSLELGRHRSNYGEIDLEPETLWFTSERGLPASIDPKKILVEFENSEVNKRGRVLKHHDVYIVNSDLSQVHINVAFDEQTPARAQVSQQLVPAPKVDSAELSKYSQTIGQQVLALASRASAIQHTSGFVKTLVEQIPEALPPIKGTFGLSIYENFGGASVHQIDAIRPGDIAVFVEANFAGAKGPLQKYQKSVPNSVYVVQEFDGTKKKLHVLDSKKESFRFGDLQSGLVKIYRVVGRDIVGW